MLKTLMIVAVLIAACPADFLHGRTPQAEENQTLTEKIPFDAFAKAFVKKRGLEGLPRQPGVLMSILEQSYVVLRLGCFDLWYPRYDLRDKNRAKEFTLLARSFLGLQAEWIQWFSSENPDSSCMQEIRVLTRWIGSLKARSLRSLDVMDGTRPDILVLTKADEEIVAASQRFADSMIRGECLGGIQREGKVISVVIAPDREDYLQLGSFIGSIDERHRAFFWNENFPLWASYTWDGTHVLALEHALHAPGKGDITKGARLDVREKTGLLEHVAQHGADYLIEAYYGNRIHPDLAAGIAINLVIAIFGQNNVRTGGGSSFQLAKAPVRFSQGPVGSSSARLNAVWYENRWRRTKGSNYFLDELKSAQKQGHKLARKTPGTVENKEAYFALESNQGGAKLVLFSLPVLSCSGDERDIPIEYKEDYLEFRRAYRSAFAHWLRLHAGSITEPLGARRLFRLLMSGAGSLSFTEPEMQFEKLVLDLYGKPFCEKSPDRDSLEIDFVKWLANE